MNKALAFLATLLCVIFLTGCGSQDKKEDPDTSSAKPSQKDDQPKEEKDPREGYFHEKESQKLNPLLTDYVAAQKLMLDPKVLKACNERAEKLYNQGKRRQSVQCHIDLTDNMIKTLTSLKTAFAQIGGQYIPACDKQRQVLDKFLTRDIELWNVVRTDWSSYQEGDDARVQKVQRNTDAAIALDNKLTQTQIPAVTKACYIASDVANPAPTPAAPKK